MQLDYRAIHIYTDGSAKDNPGGKGGLAVMVHYPDHLERDDELVFDRGFTESTNNRMELHACICALEWVRNNRGWPDVTRVQIITDSRYVAENVSRAPEWKKKGWRNRFGEPRENANLWKQLLSARQKAGIRVDFVQTPGKKSPILRAVDKAAKEARDRGFEVDRGYKPGSVSRSMVKGSAMRFPASGQIALIRPYRKSPMKTGEDKLRFDTISEDGTAYVASCFAFVTPDSASQLHKQHAYRVRFNADPNYPQIVECIEEVPLPPVVAQTTGQSAPGDVQAPESIQINRS